MVIGNQVISGDQVSGDQVSGRPGYRKEKLENSNILQNTY